MKSKTFSEIIEAVEAPNHQFGYRLQADTYTVPDEFLPIFKKLYRPPGTNNNVGNGEVVVYWLFDKKYGGHYRVARQRKRGVADLLIGGKRVEVKAWNVILKDGGLIKIGRFEKQHDIRRIINIVFGSYNVFMAGSVGEKYGAKSYLSESSFGINGLTRAFDCALKIKDINFQRLNNLRDILAISEYEGLTEPADFAAKTFAMLAIEKLESKIGANNFLINVHPLRMGTIEVFQLGDLKSVDLDLIKKGGARVKCSELFVDLLAFRRNK